VVDDPLILTGIKVLDLFSPVVKGGVIRFPFSAEVGMMVLLGELCQRFVHSINGAAVWTGFTQPPFDPDDWTAEFSELGIRDLITISLVHYMEDVQEQKGRFILGIKAAERLGDEGPDVLAIVFEAQGFESEVEASLLRLKAASPVDSLTTIIVTPHAPRQEIWSELTPPYAGQITVDLDHAKRRLFPAIHPHQSLSLGSSLISEEHDRLSRECLPLLDSDAFSSAEKGAEESGCKSDNSTGDLNAETPAAILTRYFCLLRFSFNEAFHCAPDAGVPSQSHNPVQVQWERTPILCHPRLYPPPVQTCWRRCRGTPRRTHNSAPPSSHVDSRRY